MTGTDDPMPAIVAFHQASSRHDWSVPDTPHLQTDAPKVVLPPAKLCTSALADGILQRQSCRNFAPNKSLDLSDLSCLLHTGYGHLGEVDTLNQTLETRPVPSASGSYQLSILVFAQNVTDVVPAIYRYDPEPHELVPIAGLPHAPDLVQMFLSQAYAADAPVVLMLSASPARLAELYGERGYRFALIEAGHVAQNIVVSASSFGLGCCPLGGFEDYRICCAAGLDPLHEWPLYGAALGHPDPKSAKDLRKPKDYG